MNYKGILGEQRCTLSITDIHSAAPIGELTVISSLTGLSIIYIPSASLGTKARIDLPVHSVYDLLIAVQNAYNAITGNR